MNNPKVSATQRQPLIWPLLSPLTGSLFVLYMQIPRRIRCNSPSSLLPSLLSLSLSLPFAYVYLLSFSPESNGLMWVQLGGANPNSPCTPANSLSNCDFIHQHFYNWSTFMFSRKPTSRWLCEYCFHQQYNAMWTSKIAFMVILIVIIFHLVEQYFETVNTSLSIFLFEVIENRNRFLSQKMPNIEE